MAKYIFRRLVADMLSLSILITITLFLMHVIPGGSFSPFEQGNVPEKVLEQISEEYSLNNPLPIQCVKYLGNLLHGGMGTFFKKRDTMVNGLIVNGFPVSVKVGALGIAMVLAAEIPLGIVVAVERGKLADGASMVLATIGVSMPDLVFCVLMMYAFREEWKIFPPYGLTSWKHYVLPMFCMAFSQMAYITRFMRSSMLEAMHQDYIQTECSKGVLEWEVTDKYTPKNSVLPVVTYVGLLVAALLTGTFIIEKLFSVPGLGRYFVPAITDRGHSVTLGLTMSLDVTIIGCNLIVDIMYAVIDPKVKITEQVRKMGEKVEFAMSDMIPGELPAGLSDTEWRVESINRPSISYWRNCQIRLKKDRPVMLDTVIVIITTSATIFVPMFSPYTYDQTDFGNALQWPNSTHLFGTNKMERDIFVRAMYGTHISLSIGPAVAAIGVVTGVLYGGISGYVGGTADTITMCMVDILTDIPSLTYMILIMMFLRNTIQSTLTVMCLAYRITTARMVWAQILTLGERGFVLVAKISGLNKWRILTHHLIPNSMGSIIVAVTSLIPSAAFQETFLSSPDIGIQVLEASWGTLANDAIEYLFSYPYQVLFPTLATNITMFTLNSIGNGLRDALDPRLKK